ncbi:hypothetical protein V1512DRAFT_111970 [Lipomyces arxii]|uniref:uncharacterized protein n=1 Tax=Lipomyces arxii TaxID=56418 RepID=UPI0034CFA07A
MEDDVFEGIIEPVDEILDGFDSSKAEEPKYIRLKRQKQNFENWFRRQEELLAKRLGEDPSSDEEEDQSQQVKLVVKRTNVVKTTKEDIDEAVQMRIVKQSQFTAAKEMYSKSPAPISTPRDYQLELFDYAKERNVIAVLDTGSGKTLIACLLIKHMLEKEQDRREKGQSKKIAICLVDSVTLVFQQSSVISLNVPFNVAKFCGQMGVDYWDKETWTKHFEENDVFVMTADVFYNCLTVNFLSLTNTCLLIFDECHHSKKTHVFRRIMYEFYEKLDDDERPKIFGMTASPVDAKVDVEKAARDLEKSMDSQILTTRNSGLLQQIAPRPKTTVLYYNFSSSFHPTSLFQTLKEMFLESTCLDPLFRFAEFAAEELGSWCSDQVWSYLVENSMSERSAGLSRQEQLEMLLNNELQQNNIKAVQDKLILTQARTVVSGNKFDPPVFDSSRLSDKVLSVLALLRKSYEGQKKKIKTIVFVERRFTAWILHDLLQYLDIPGCKPGFVTGHGSTSGSDVHMTFRDQSMCLYDFRRGKVNCLVSTSVVEEGFDVPDCNLIIRFDLCKTAIQYIQSRGRARQSSSLFVHMAMRHNADDNKILREVAVSEEKMRQFCEMLPEDRILQGGNDDSETDRDFLKLHYEEPTTRARVSDGSAPMLLANFLSSQPHDEFGKPIAKFIYIKDKHLKFYRVNIVVPSKYGTITVHGETHASRKLAKRDAVFKMVVELRRRDLLNEYLLPHHVKKIRYHDVKKRTLATSSNEFSVRSAEFWKPIPFQMDETAEDSHVLIYMAVFEMPNHLGSYRPLCFLSRRKHHQYVSCPLFVDGEYIPVECKVISTPLKVSLSYMAKLAQYTVVIFYDVFGRRFDTDLRDFPYFLAPYLPETSDIDWDLVTEACKTLDEAEKPLTWDVIPDSQFWEGKFVIDGRSRHRQFETRKLVPELNEDSQIPDRFPSSLTYPTIKHYSYSAKVLSPERSRLLNQPVLAAKRILYGLNFLRASGEQEGDRKSDAVVIPGPLFISRVDAASMRSARLLPSLLYYMESCVQAAELCKLLRIDKFDMQHMIEAITFVSAHSDYNYERLEFLGDAFLKACTSISLFIQNPDGDEYEFHSRRLNMICNQNLYDTAIEYKMYEYMRATPFNRRVWYPDYMVLLNKESQAIRVVKSHVLGDKGLADVCEAVIGACYLQGLDDGVHAVTQLVRSPDHTFHKWAEYSSAYKIPEYQLNPGTAADRKIADEISQVLGYTFKAPLLVRSSFMHSSFLQRDIPSYQRLEFLGDALLELLCVHYVYEKYPEFDPQYLTEHKMPMISNKFLGYLSVKLKLHRYLDHMSAPLAASIREYAQAIELEEIQAKVEDREQLWADIETPTPKAIADCVEALLGAVLIDSDFNLGEVQGCFDRLIVPYFEDFTRYENAGVRHPPAKVAELCSEVWCNDWKIHCREFRLNGKQVVMSAVQIHGQIVGSGDGTTLKNARFSASKAALKKLAAEPNWLKNTCNCASETVI